MPDSVVHEAVVGAGLTASRTVTAPSVKPMVAVTTAAHHSTLVFVALRGPKRLVEVAVAVGVTSPTAARMCDHCPSDIDDSLAGNQ